jgi:F-type H+-transporting ATPase subunit delta
VKQGKAKTLALVRKLVEASMEGGEPSPVRVDAVLALLRKRPESQRKVLLGVYLRMMRRAEALRTLSIERAGPLAADSKTSLVAGMEKHGGRKLVVTEKENAALIGGLKVRLGDDVYDASLQGILDRIGHGHF